MSNVLIRDLPDEVVERIKSEAAAQGVSLQHYLWNTMRAQADYLNRQDALARVTHRLGGRPAVSEEERQAVFDAVDAEHDERAEQLIDRPGQ